MAGRAILREHRLADVLRKVEQLRVLDDLLDRRAGDAVQPDLLRIGGSGRLPLVARARRIAQHAGGVADEAWPGGIDHPTTDRPHDRGVKDVEPPFRQGRVQFLDAVPFVPGRRRTGHRIAFDLTVKAPAGLRSGGNDAGYRMYPRASIFSRICWAD